MNGTAVAYIRRSVSRTGDRGDVSREFQTNAVRSLANGDGPTLRIIDQDWGRSAGTDSTDKRLAFLGLIGAVERGEVSTLYAYSGDRLARSIEWAARLWNACERTGTAIVTVRQTYDTSNDRDWRDWSRDAEDNESALRSMRGKSSAVAGKRKERGDQMGRAPYGYKHEMIGGVSTLVPREGEDPQHIVDVFLEAGSYLEAARALNAEGYPTRFAGKKWDPTTVRHIVIRKAPEVVPVRTRRGATTRAARLFAGLLQCPHWERHPDTPILTSGPSKYGVRYYCRVAHMDGEHPRPYIVAESKIVDWAKRVLKVELGGRMRRETAGKAPSAESKVAALDARRQRVLEAFLDGDIDRSEKTRQLAAIDAEMPALESGRRAVASLRDGTLTFAVRDWDNPTALNAELRNLWQRIELGPDMLPVRPVWNIGQRPDDQS